MRGLADGPLPAGRHALTVEADGRRDTAVLLVAPERPGPAPYSWGFLVQLYFLLSRRSWGMGDLGDLSSLVSWAGRELGADFVQLGPLHAMEPGPLPDPSPYRPSSRRFPDPMHVRVESVPEFAGLADGPRGRVRYLADRAAELNASVLDGSSLILREEVRDLKLRALREVYEVPRTPAREAAFAAFTDREGADLIDFATWCALAEVHGPAWRSWPAGLRDPRSPEVARARRVLAASVGFHRWLAWITDEQLAGAQRAARDAGMRIGLVHDLAVGVAPEGADAWALRHCLAEGMSVGAPPDDFNPAGQDWNQPPWRPDALAAEGYRPLAALLRSGLRHAGALRVDHVMGLFRLWWVPEGRPPSEGTYVRYDGAAMLAVLAAEAADAGALVIGEDLGTVEAGVREALADRGVIGTAVQRFEYEGGSEGRLGPLAPEKWREHCLATLTTHDLPSTAAWLSGEHVDLRDRLGLLTRPVAEERAEAARERDGWLAELERLGLLPDPAGEVAALHAYLGRTPARMIGVWLPDLTGDRRPQNLPGTAGPHPNWCLPVADAEGRPVPLEELTGAPLAHHLAEAFAGRPEAHRDTIEERHA
ncbi:4-alpha-glucanotransferase [Streptomyces filamentosus]|uniref:4-alpha-glucanotransferase n=1 Tax=Streptomyces filamentosus TaxID=67294 RepID=UPI0033DFAB2F